MWEEELRRVTAADSNHTLQHHSSDNNFDELIWQLVGDLDPTNDGLEPPRRQSREEEEEEEGEGRLSSGEHRDNYQRLVRFAFGKKKKRRKTLVDILHKAKFEIDLRFDQIFMDRRWGPSSASVDKRDKPLRNQ